MKSLPVKLGVILIGFAIFSYAEVWGADWILVDRNLTGDVFWDRENIRYLEGGIVRFWEKCVLNEKGVDVYIERYGIKFRNVAEHRSLIEIDCKEKQYRYLEVNWYSKDGQLISNMELKPSQWMHITPESSGDAYHKILCK